MKMRSISALLLIVLVVGVVSAVTVGNIITQSQLNALNISEMDLDEEFVRKANGDIKYQCERNKCKFGINLKYLERSGEDFIVSEVTRVIEIDLKKYKTMRDEHDLSFARSKLKEDLKGQRDDLVERYRTAMKRFQTEEEIETEDLLGGLRNL